MARVFFAGAESPVHLEDLLVNGASNVLFSFYYIQRRGNMDAVFALLDEYPSVNVFLDSGAFTYQSSNAVREAPASYMQRYRKFIRDYGHYFEFAAEFDVDGFDDTCTQEQLDEWRDQLASVGTVPIVPVWHENRGYDAWESYCEDPRFLHLGVGSYGDSKRDTTGIESRLVNRAHLFGKTVHGFAQTKVLTTLRYIKYDTVDSTTWQVGDRFGDTCIFWKNKWVRLNAQQGGKEARRKYRSYFKAIGCNFRKILQDDREEIRKANIIAWENVSQRLQVIHRSHVGESQQVTERDGSVHYERTAGFRPAAYAPDQKGVTLRKKTKDLTYGKDNKVFTKKPRPAAPPPPAAPSGRAHEPADDQHGPVERFREHMESCETCMRHQGHVPFGLCEVGFSMYGALADTADIDDQPDRDDLSHQMGPTLVPYSEVEGQRSTTVFGSAAAPTPTRKRISLLDVADSIMSADDAPITSNAQRKAGAAATVPLHSEPLTRTRTRIPPETAKGPLNEHSVEHTPADIPVYDREPDEGVVAREETDGNGKNGLKIGPQEGHSGGVAPLHVHLTPPRTAISVSTQESGEISPRKRAGVMPKGVPILHCSICMIGPECPEYKEGLVCAFDAAFKSVPTRDLHDITTLAAGVLEENTMRLRRARLVEDLVMGGQVDGATTALSETVMAQAKQVADLIRTRKVATIETQGEGILSKLFGGLGTPTQALGGEAQAPGLPPAEDLGDVIDLQPTETESRVAPAKVAVVTGTGRDGED